MVAVVSKGETSPTEERQKIRNRFKTNSIKLAIYFWIDILNSSSAFSQTTNFRNRQPLTSLVWISNYETLSQLCWQLAARWQRHTKSASTPLDLATSSIPLSDKPNTSDCNIPSGDEFEFWFSSSFGWDSDGGSRKVFVNLPPINSPAIFSQVIPLSAGWQVPPDRLDGHQKIIAFGSPKADLLGDHQDRLVSCQL